MSEEFGSVTCPYCGLAQRVGGSTYSMEAHCCDVNEGGCDRYFAFAITKIVRIEAFEIEGQAERKEE